MPTARPQYDPTWSNVAQTRLRWSLRTDSMAAEDWPRKPEADRVRKALRTIKG